MKLCIVTPYVMKGDGQGRANYEIVWEAIRRGHRVTLLARSVSPDLQRHPQVQWVHIAVKQFPTELLREQIFSWKSARWLQQHRSEFDLVQVYGAVTSAPGDINTVQFVHRGWLQSPAHTARIRRDYYGAYQWVYSRLNAYLEKPALRQAKVVIAVSQKIRQELIDLGIAPEKIQVILNGVDLQEFFPGEADRRQLGLPEQVPLAVFVGDIRTSRKNLDTVLQALVSVPALHLAVLGSLAGSPYPQLATKLELDGRVHFLDFRRDVAAVMRAADLFVFPSRYEACTLALLEAMASGLPVVTADSTGGAEIVSPDCGAVLPDSEDSQALAQILEQLVNQPDQRRQLGQAARLIAEQHSWASKAQAYVDLFEDVCRA